MAGVKTKAYMVKENVEYTPISREMELKFELRFYHMLCYQLPAKKLSVSHKESKKEGLGKWARTRESPLWSHLFRHLFRHL